jgi:hypothetical protein
MCSRIQLHVKLVIACQVHWVDPQLELGRLVHLEHLQATRNYADYSEHKLVHAVANSDRRSLRTCLWLDPSPPLLSQCVQGKECYGQSVSVLKKKAILTKVGPLPTSC